jgi:branched-chain amino acid transport system substrate-binding protein
MNRIFPANLGFLIALATCASAKPIKTAQVSNPSTASEVPAQLSSTAGFDKLQSIVDSLTLHPTTELLAQAAVIVDQELTFNGMVSLWNDVRNELAWEPLKPLLAFKLAKIYYHVRQYKDAESMAQLVVDKFPNTSQAQDAQTFLTFLRDRFSVDANAVGVVLPLSGKFQQYGERALAAVQLVFNTPTIRLVIKDGKGEAAATAKAVEELVVNDHVIAIIGPLFSNEATAAAIKAEELSVPLFALSHQAGLPEMGRYVFRTALTIRMQAQALAKVAFEDLGYTQFAILKPRTPYGEEFVQAFWDEVDKRKGEIRGIEEYNHDQTTFREPIRKLVGRWYLSLRTDFQEGLAAINQQQLPSHKKKAAIESLEKSLPPIVDFEAIVMPDTGKSISLIAPAIAFEDVMLNQDPQVLQKLKQSGKNSKPVRLLGASTWNNPRIAQSCERYCENAIFVDAFFSQRNDPKVQQFVAGFRDKTHTEPSLSEAQAYDTAGLLNWIISASKPVDREALLKVLTSGIAYKGVTGAMHFDEIGETARELQILTIKERTIRVWDKSLEPPRG